MSDGFSKGYKYHGYADEPVSDACGDGRHGECTFDLTKCHCKYRYGHTTMHSYANPTLPLTQPAAQEVAAQQEETRRNLCRAKRIKNPFYECTLPKGHTGQHEAHGIGENRMFDSWAAEPRGAEPTAPAAEGTLEGWKKIARMREQQRDTLVEQVKILENKLAASGQVEAGPSAITVEDIAQAISQWYDEAIAGDGAPDFWDECDTSDRLARYLKNQTHFFPVSAPASQPIIEQLKDAIGGLIATYETSDHADNPCGHCAICTADELANGEALSAPKAPQQDLSFQFKETLDDKLDKALQDGLKPEEDWTNLEKVAAAIAEELYCPHWKVRKERRKGLCDKCSDKAKAILAKWMVSVAPKIEYS